MNLRKIGIAIVLNVICAVGATLVPLGVIFSWWFFFSSEQTNKFFWGGLSIIAACIGYAIYRYAFQKTHKKCGDHY